MPAFVFSVSSWFVASWDLGFGIWDLGFGFWDFLRSHRPCQTRRRDIANRRRSHLTHRQGQFRAQDFEDALDALLAERREAPDVRAADADTASTRRQRLVDVRAVAESAIDEDRNASADRLHDFGQAIDGGAKRLGGAPAVVRDDDAIGAEIGR